MLIDLSQHVDVMVMSPAELAMHVVLCTEEVWTGSGCSHVTAGYCTSCWCCWWPLYDNSLGWKSKEPSGPLCFWCG